MTCRQLLSFRQEAVEIGTAIQPAVFYDRADALCVLDVFQGICVQKHKIGELAGLDHAEVGSALKCLRRVQSGRLQGFKRRETSSDERRKLPVKGESDQARPCGIGPRDEPDPILVHAGSHVDKRVHVIAHEAEIGR